MRCAYCTLRLLTGLGAAGWVLPPVVRRGEGTRSGAPSWTTAQTPAVQGCTVCVVPPDLLPEPREPDAGGRTSGGGLSFGDFSLATQRKVTRQAAQRRRNPIEDGVLVSCMAKPCQLGGDIPPSNDVTDPLTLTFSRKGRGDGYLGAGAGDRLVSAKVATAPGSRYQIAPLTIDLGKGVNRRPSPYYGARVVLSMVLMS